MQWHSNPFSSRFVRPGQVAFQFPPGVDAIGLVARLRSFRWRAQIVGPHGTGKSTLLHALLPTLREQGRDIVWYTLSAGQRRLGVPIVVPAGRPGSERTAALRATSGVMPDEPSGSSDTDAIVAHWCRSTLVIVDGYEQLGIAARLRLRTKCHYSGAGLLVTSHSSTGLPTLFETHVSFETFHTLVSQLAGGKLDWIDPVELRSCYERAAGNARDAFFELYDRYETRQSRDGVFND